MKMLTTLITLVLAGFSGSAASQTTQAWQIDYSGKPPFKRQLIEIAVVDAAQLEMTETTVLQSTDFAGKPPFKRNVETLEVVDMAVLEQADTDDQSNFKGRPPFKRH